MSGSTIIDSLVVLFGLDPSGYKKGVDEVAKAEEALQAKQKKGVVNTEKEEKALADARKKRAQAIEKQGNDTIKSVGEVGRALATMLLGFEGVTGFAKWMAELNQSEAQMGRTSLKIGLGVHEMNKWGNATALAGGKAEDAQEAFGRIATEFNTQHVTGQIGPLLTFLRARGVAVADANGKLRNQGEILEELADKTAQYGSVYQANMFRQAGLNEGEIDYLIQAKALREQQLAIAEKNNGLTAEQVADAKRLAQEWVNVKQEITDVGQHILTDISPNILYILHTVGQLGDVLAKIPHASEALKGALNPFASVVGMFQEDYDKLTAPSANTNTAAPSAPRVSGFSRPQESYSEIWSDFRKGLHGAVASANADYKSAQRAVDPMQKAQILQTIAATETQLGIPAGLLARVAQQESHFRPDIISGQTKSPAGAVGLMQLLPKYFPDAGKNTDNDIKTAGTELMRLYKVFGDWSKAVAAYNDGEGNEKKILAGKKVMPEETRRYIAAVAPTPGISAGAGNDNSSTSNVTHISAPISIMAQNADPAAVADQAAGALQRKFAAAQAFQGQT